MNQLEESQAAINERRAKVQNFLKTLNKPVTPGQIKVNKFANDSKYIPISFIETRLDQYFFGLWETVNFRTQVIVNEVVGSIDLRVKHPVTGDWITRTGAAGVPIQMKSGSGVTQVGEKIHNTLVKDYPHLKAMCVLNAVKSLGKMFGRDLNRKFEDDYQPLLRLPENDMITNKQAQYIESLIHNSTLDGQTLQDIENRMMRMIQPENHDHQMTATQKRNFHSLKRRKTYRHLLLRFGLTIRHFRCVTCNFLLILFSFCRC